MSLIAAHPITINFQQLLWEEIKNKINVFDNCSFDASLESVDLQLYIKNTYDHINKREKSYVIGHIIYNMVVAELAQCVDFEIKPISLNHISGENGVVKYALQPDTDNIVSHLVDESLRYVEKNLDLGLKV